MATIVWNPKYLPFVLVGLLAIFGFIFIVLAVTIAYEIASHYLGAIIVIAMLAIVAIVALSEQTNKTT